MAENWRECWILPEAVDDKVYRGFFILNVGIFGCHHLLTYFEMVSEVVIDLSIFQLNALCFNFEELVIFFCGPIDVCYYLLYEIMGVVVSCGTSRSPKISMGTPLMTADRRRF